jgi:hypothetical protein
VALFEGKISMLHMRDVDVDIAGEALPNFICAISCIHLKRLSFSPIKFPNYLSRSNHDRQRIWPDN